jgi:hypothetical protein
VPVPLVEQVPRLRLGGLLPRFEFGHSRAAALPAPGRDPGLLLGDAQRIARRAAAVTDGDLAQVVAVRLPGGDQR